MPEFRGTQVEREDEQGARVVEAQVCPRAGQCANRFQQVAVEVGIDGPLIGSGERRPLRRKNVASAAADRHVVAQDRIDHHVVAPSAVVSVR